MNRVLLLCKKQSMTRMLQFSKDDSFLLDWFYIRALKTSTQEQATDNFIFQCPLLQCAEADLGAGTSASDSSSFLTRSHPRKTPAKPRSGLPLWWLGIALLGRSSCEDPFCMAIPQMLNERCCSRTVLNQIYCRGPQLNVWLQEHRCLNQMVTDEWQGWTMAVLI